MDTRVLSSTNTGISVNLDGTTAVNYAPNFLPLGTVGGTAGGELFVKAGIVGSVTPFQYSGTGASGAPVFSTTAINACTIPAGGRGFVQNEAAVALLVRLGTGAATNAYSFKLKGAGTAGDGSGGFVYINDYTGIVSCCPSANTTNFLAWAST